MANADATNEAVKDAVDGQTVALRVIAALLLIGAAWVATSLLVPFVLAVMLAIALSPVADWLERKGFLRSLSALTCTLAVTALIALAVGLIVYQAGTIVQDSDRYLKRFGSVIDHAVKRTHTERAVGTLGLVAHERSSGERGDTKGAVHEGSRPAGGKDQARVQGEDEGREKARAGDGETFLNGGLATVGRWLLTGVGGLLGVLGGGVLFLAFLFYMIEGRRGWVDALTAAGRRLGMKPAPGRLEKIRHEMTTYYACLSAVAAAYVVVVSSLLWLIGVPQPLLWGLMAGMLEVVPYFGPLIASVMPTLVALSLGHWWQPVAVVAMFLTLHLVEGYLITPKLYGRAVRLDPVTILFGSIFFGGLWGPAGLAIAMPMMIVLRGLLLISPDTPALDALAGVKAEKAAAPAPVGSGV